MKVASVSSTCAVIATRADLPETSGVSLGLPKTDVKASAVGVGNHRRGSCPSIHSSVCQRRRSPPTMTSFALALPVLVMAATITAMPVHRRAPRHSRTSNVVNPTPLHVLDDNLRDGWRPSPSDVDRARRYLIQDRLHDQDFNVLPHLANKLAKYNAHDGVLSAIADALQRHQERVNRYNSREIAMLLHSLAKRRIKKRVLFNALGNRALEIMPDFNPQCVANTAWAFATLSIQNRALFNALGRRALEIISGFNPQNVANTAWAFATLSIQNRLLFNALGNRALAMMADFNAQGVANTAWAFAKLSIQNRALFSALGRRALEIISGFKPQEVANTAWAFATLSIQNRLLFNALGSRALEIMSGFKPQDVANTAWAFATLSFQNRALFNALGSRALEIISGFNPQNVANTAWAFATVSIQNRALFNALGGRALAMITDFNPQNVANTAWAFATVSIQNRALFNALGSRTLAMITDFNPQDIANTAWAFATVWVENLALFNALANRVVETMSEFNPQHVGNTMWAFSAVRFDPDNRIVEAMVGRTCFFYSDGSFSDEHLVQLHLWRLFVGESRFDSVVDRVCHVKTDVMVSRFRDAMSRTMQLHVSRMEGEVVDALSRMYQRGYVVSGYICPGTGYSIDAALPKERIAVEVNGPMHFLRDCCSNRVTSMNGASRLKRYLLERYGWRIVDVNFEDWDKTGGDREQQQELLQQLLAPFS
ncbi:RAP domain-containing protein [Plasmodiophora brassicae]